MSRRYSTVGPLSADHDPSEFDCGSAPQTNWLRKHALQAQQSGTSRVYVVCRTGTRRVVGYHALAAGSVEREGAPGRVRRGTGRHPIPVTILTRLGVDVTEQGRGLGTSLLKDALLRVVRAGDEIGVRALLIHAESEAARAFYLRLAEFEPAPTDPLHLFLLMKDVTATIAAERT